VLFVGAFPPADSKVIGGNVSDCRALLASSLPQEIDLILLDSTQISLPAPGLFRRAWLAVLRIARFLSLFESRRPDALLIFASSGLSFLEKAGFAAYGRMRGVRSLFSVRSGHFLDRCRRSAGFRALARLSLRACDRLLCQGDQWRRFFTAEMGIAPAKCVVLENWVASDELLAIAERRGSAPGRPVRILFMGWIERFKGVFELIEAAAQLRSDAQVQPFVIELAGAGGDYDAIRSRIEAASLSTLVSLKGLIEGEGKLAALAAADIFVLPSHTEGLPNAMIEAMAAGLPVVVTPVGSIPDVVVNGVNGILVPPRDSQALAAALRRLIESPQEREALGGHAHETAKARFGTERAARALVSLVDAVTA
jgi:glycosyltransferase involved in cell wall biosynthesis